jgi:hypothetical protein
METGNAKAHLARQKPRTSEEFRMLWLGLPWLLAGPVLPVLGLSGTWQLGWLLLWGLGVLLWVGALHKSWQQQWLDMQLALEKVAHGDLSLSAAKGARAAASSLTKSMVHALSAMVADVRSNAALVAQAGQSMVKDHQALSERTEMQASNLAQTVVSVEQLTAAVEHNAEVSKAHIPALTACARLPIRAPKPCSMRCSRWS